MCVSRTKDVRVSIPMKKICSILIPALFVALAAMPARAAAPSGCDNAEFQYSVVLNNQSIGSKAAYDFVAYVWIPPSCERVRGLFLTHQNVGEELLTEHPLIREVCAKNDIAIIWSNPPLDRSYRTVTPQFIALQQKMLDQLAEISGYAELATAPWITFGHSSTTIFAHKLAEAFPDRTIGVISAKGGFSYPEFDKYNGPVVYTGGQFPEWRQPTQDWKTRGRSLKVLQSVREVQARQFRPVSFVEECGDGHFDFSEPYIKFLALYMDRICKHRIKPDGTLRPVDPNDGYIVDMQLPLPVLPLKAKRYADATGEERNAPFFIDRETADAAVELMSYLGSWQRKNQIVAFVNLDGTPALFNSNGIVGPVPVEYEADGVTIKRFATAFLDKLPADFKQAGLKFGHAKTGERTIEWVCGMLKPAPDGKWRIQLNRSYEWPGQMRNFIVVRHPGDAEYRPSVQPARFVPPEYNGKQHKVNFPAIADCNVNTKEIPLKATCTNKKQVYYYVRSGPVKVEDGKLVMLPLPPRAKYPVKVTVVAWQIGREGKDPFVTAERSFNITK